MNCDTMLLKNKHFLMILFFISLIIRLLFYFVFLSENPCQLAYDSGHYHSVAIKLARGQGYVDFNGQPYFYRLPGFPFFLAVCYKFFGIVPLYAMLVQILVAACIPLLVFFLSVSMFPTKIRCAKIASMLASIHPGYLIFSGLVMSETLFVIFFTLFLICFFSMQRSAVMTYSFGAGIFLGCASLIRPVGQFAIVITIFLLLLTSLPINKKMKQIMILLLGWGALVVPWLLRNYMLTGYVFFHTLFGPHFLNHAAVRLEMQHDNSSYREARNKVYKNYDEALKQAATKKGSSLLEIERAQVAQSIAVGSMTQNFFVTSVFAMKNIFKTAFSLYSSELLMIDSGGKLPSYDGKRGLVDMVERFLLPDVNNRWIIGVIYFELLLLFLVLIGFIKFLYQACLYRTNVYQALQIITLIGLFIGLSFVCGFARLRLPIEVFFIILLGVYISD